MSSAWNFINKNSIFLTLNSSWLSLSKWGISLALSCLHKLLKEQTLWLTNSKNVFSNIYMIRWMKVESSFRRNHTMWQKWVFFICQPLIILVMKLTWTNTIAIYYHVTNTKMINLDGNNIFKARSSNSSLKRNF